MAEKLADRLAGLPQGYSGKLLGKDGAGKKQKRMWPVGLESMLGVLGLKVLLIEDEAATARTLALREPVDRAQQRFGNICRIKATLLPPPAPKPLLRILKNGQPAAANTAERTPARTTVALKCLAHSRCSVAILSKFFVDPPPAIVSPPNLAR